MDTLIKKKIKALSNAVFHMIIPTSFFLIITQLWNTSISNDTSMDWNIFVSISCFGIFISFILLVFFIEWIVDKYFWSVVKQFKEEK